MTTTKKFDPSWRPPNDTPPQPMNLWMNPLNKIRWHRAVKRRANTVTLEDGRKFTLDYYKRKGSVWVAPTNGDFVPCGWLSIELVEDKAKWFGGKPDETGD